MKNPAQRIIEVERDFKDHRKFATESLSILDKRGVKVRYSFAPGPTKLLNAINSQKEAGKPVRVIVLKARAVYISTAVAAQYVHETAFLSGQKALIVSHAAKSAENILSYYKQFTTGYKPFRGVVRMLPHKINESKISFEGGGYIDVATANTLTTGRSFSFRHLHLSEYPFYKDAATLTAALLPAIPNDPGTSIIKESSANGVGNEFYEDWIQASDPTSGSNYIPVFLGYWEHPEYVEYVEDRARFQDSLTQEEIEERGKYQLSLEQLQWRRTTVREICRGSVELFRQEYPGNPAEAFLQSGRMRFSNTALAKMPVLPGALVGELHVDEHAANKRITFLPTDTGAVVIYKKPTPGRAYVIGVDVAEGRDASEGQLGRADPDYTVACVLDRDTGEQVAKLRGRIWPSTAGALVAVLAQWYGWAFIVPERNSVGVAFIDALLYANYPTYLIFHGQPSPDETIADQVEYTRLGWQTNTTSRVHLVSTLDQALRETAVMVRDPHTLLELKTFIIWPNGHCKAARRCHDDEVIALALAAIGMRFAPADTRLNILRSQQPAAMRGNPTVQTYGGRAGGDPDRDRRGPLYRL